MRPEMSCKAWQDHWYMARRQNWEDCVQKISGLKEEMEEQRQSIHCERQTQQELRGAWATLNEKLEALQCFSFCLKAIRSTDV